MSSLIHPADHSVAELKRVLEDVDDAETLERLLDAERTGENRVTALDAIEQRLTAVTNEADEETSGAEGVSGAEDTTSDEEVGSEEEPVVDEDAGRQNGNGTAIIEESWSKDTVASLGRSTSAESGAATGTETPAEPPQSNRQSEAGATAVGASERTATRAEAASLSTTVTDGDDDVGEQLLENIERIRHTFENSAAEDGRMEARIRQLQTEVGDLKAYTNALEEFLTEEGTGRQVIESVRGDIDSLETDLTDVTNDVRIHGRNLEALWDVVEDAESELSRLHELLDRTTHDVTSVATDVETVEDELDEFRATADGRFEAHADALDGVDEALSTHDEALSSHDDSLESLGDEVEDVAAQIDTVEGQIDTAADDVRELDTRVSERFADSTEEREELAGRIADNAERIEAVSTNVDDLANRIESVEALLDDAGHVDDRFATVEEELEELHEWREQLSSVLLSSAGAEPDSTES
jgi:chromosome segregation ATPase